MKMKSGRAFYAQILFVALAFIIMTALSYMFMSSVVRGNLVRTAEGMLDVTKARATSRLDGFESVMESFAGEMRGIIMRGGQTDALQAYIDNISRFIFLDGHALSGIQDFYGYFETLPGGPALLYSGRRSLPKEGAPEESDWRRLAAGAGGAVVETTPSVGGGGEVSYKYAKCILDDAGRRLGVVGMDVLINKIGQEAVSTALNQGGYGMLMNQDLVVMFHPNPDFVGVNMTDASMPVHIFADERREGKEITERPLTSYKGEDSVAFFRRLSNGWYLGIVMPESRYYASLNTMAATLGALGALLAAALIGILVRIERGRAKSDSENRQKSMFLANMSHEIRTPLNTVIGLSELTLDSDRLEGDMEDKLEKIRASGMTILSIVNDILDISKIESGKFELFPAKYDIPSLINDIVTLNAVRIGEKPIALKLDVNENLPSSLCGDDLRIRQIFNNLLSNAFKYTESGTVEWRISFERDGDAVWLVSSVRDTGIGMKPEGVARLFSEYNQVDAQANRKVEGTGLGLAITKRFVEMMGGSITAESEYGKGSAFHVRLRQSVAREAPIGGDVARSLMDMRYTLAKRGRNRKLAHADLSYARVLVVDDIATNLDVARGMLKPYGLKIDCATSGRRAIEAIRAEKPRYDAIFMDHMMPEMDGIEATRIIREEIGTEYARNIPIVALTANAIVGNEEMFL
ncbi:MAG: response regulator, partial [Planctomycetota bacterium]|nr:response regulator [Planctomycetota bacterium]